jgi:hypothetical protein
VQNKKMSIEKLRGRLSPMPGMFYHFPDMGHNRTEATPAAVLKAIRDGKANDWNDFNTLFLNDPYSRTSLRRTVGELETAGLITRAGEKYSVTETWMKIQGALGVSLTSLDEMAQKGVTTVKPVFGLPDQQRTVPDVFVLMPFIDELKPIFATHISRVVQGLGLTVGRADDFFTAHAVIQDVWTAIWRTRVLIADCTDRNPNVFYEIGMAHTVGKPVILITKHETDVPFDLRHLRFIKYVYTPPGMDAFESSLGSTIRTVLNM